MTVAHRSSTDGKGKERKNDQRVPQQHTRLVAYYCEEERGIGNSRSPFPVCLDGGRAVHFDGALYRVLSVHTLCMCCLFLRRSIRLRAFRQSYQEVCQAATPTGSDNIKILWVRIDSPSQPICCALRKSDTVPLFALIVCLVRTLLSCSFTLVRWCSRLLRCPSTLHSPITPVFVCGPRFWWPHLPLWSLCLGSGGATTIPFKL